MLPYRDLEPTKASFADQHKAFSETIRLLGAHSGLEGPIGTLPGFWIPSKDTSTSRASATSG